MDKWLADKPQVIKDLAARFPPGLYNLSSGHVVYIIAYSEDGTLRVGVSNKYNEGLSFEIEVFGVKPEDLMPHER